MASASVKLMLIISDSGGARLVVLTYLPVFRNLWIFCRRPLWATPKVDEVIIALYSFDKETKIKAGDLYVRITQRFLPKNPL